MIETEYVKLKSIEIVSTRQENAFAVEIEVIHLSCLSKLCETGIILKNQ